MDGAKGEGAGHRTLPCPVAAPLYEVNLRLTKRGSLRGHCRVGGFSAMKKMYFVSQVRRVTRWETQQQER